MCVRCGIGAGSDTLYHEALVEEYGDELYSWAYYKTSSNEIAEDLVQETFLSAHKNIASFKQESNPKAWLFTILNNKIIDHYRSAVNKRMSNESSLIKETEQALFNDQGGWLESSVTRWNEEPHLLDKTEFIAVLQRCIENLPERWKAVIMSKYYLNKNAKTICKELDITPSNLWQMVFRAKNHLKQCLDKNWDNEE